MPIYDPVYVGIDLACARGKRLPVCFAKREPGPNEKPRLMPLVVPFDQIPRGRGNGEIAKDRPFQQVANDIALTLKTIANEMHWSIVCIAIDAPAAPSIQGVRSCERRMKDEGISSFTTPTREKVVDIVKACKAHVKEKKPLSKLPNANRIWMLYGFELFAALREEKGWEIIEVYPNAIVRELGCVKHKSTPEGYLEQLTAVAERVGWEPAELGEKLYRAVTGSRHDRLDAFLAAWVASLPHTERTCHGCAEDPDDSIWVPNISTARHRQA